MGLAEELSDGVRSGIYLYQFDALPEAVIEVLDKHFLQVEEDLRNKFGFASTYV